MPILRTGLRPCRSFAAALGVGLLVAATAHADAGFPSLRPDQPTWIEVEINLDGRRSIDRGWETLLLVPSVTMPDSNEVSKKVFSPALALWVTTQAPNADNTYWVPGTETPQLTRQGVVRFGFPSRVRGRKGESIFPTHVRLAVCEPYTKKVYVTAPAETRSENANYFSATLREDGGGTLELEPLWSGPMLLRLGGPFLIALGLTMLTQLVIAALWVTIFRPTEGGTRLYGRVLLTTLAANLIGVPALFLLGVVTKTHTDNPLVYLFVLIVGPVLVILGAAVLYATWGRLPVKHAAWLSTVANLCTVVFCCGGVWNYGW
jgi:hypothetical protein